MYQSPNENELPADVPSPLPGGPDTGGALTPLAPDLASPEPKQREGHIKTTVEKVRAAYVERIAGGDVSEEQVSVLTQLLEIGKVQKMNLTELAKAIDYDVTTLHRLFNGEYKAKLDKPVQKIRDYVKLWMERATHGEGVFVETSICKTIWQASDTARAYSLPIPVYGDSQLGKSWAAEEYKNRNNHGQTIYIRMPFGGQLMKFLRALNKALGENADRNSWVLTERPKQILNNTKLLIVDELHQCMVTTAKTDVRVMTLEYLRELYDMTGCGMLLIGTNIARDAMERGKHASLLEQFRRRGVPPIQLPDMLPDADLDAIAAPYGLSEAPAEFADWRRTLVKTTGLKAYVTFLRAGSAIANKHSTPLCWKHVRAAHDVLAKLSLKKP